ncbi:hypothetical protein BJ944DRAFT_288113, partial [Cunninghamella echinulata]
MTINTLWIKLYITILLVFLQPFYQANAAPINNTTDILGIDAKNWDILSVITTVIFSYFAHAFAIRPERTKRLSPTILSFVAAFAWPMNGVYDAYTAIYKYFNQDYILYECPIEFPIKYFRTSLYEDNGIYLKEELTKLDKQSRKSVKHSILNGNIFLGYDDILSTHRDKYAIKTKDMSIGGPGSRKKYQASLHPASIRFLPKPMINQIINEAKGIESKSLGSLFVTSLQLSYSSYKIFVAPGNSWGKLILGIYMIMTILQTLSRLLLPTQLIVFSISVTEEVEETFCKIPAMITMETKNLVSFSALGTDVNFFTDQNDDQLCIQSFNSSRKGFDPLLSHQSKNGIDSLVGPIQRLTWKDKCHRYIVLFIVVVVPLLLGIIADYHQNSIEQWLVLSWIVSSYPFLWLAARFYTPFMFVPNFTYYCCLPNLDAEYFVYVQLMNLVGLGLVISATIISYLDE